MAVSGVETWVASRRGGVRMALAIGLGAALALGHAPFDFPWIWIVGFPALILLIRAGARPARTGWLAGLGYFGLSLHWIVEPFLVDAARHGWMVPFALVLLSGGLALFWGAAAWVAVWLAARGMVLWAGFPVVLALAEFARARVLTGFPWAHPIYVWVDTPIAQLAAWLGPHGLGLVVMLALGAIASRNGWLALCGVAALVGLYAGGQWRASDDVNLVTDAAIVRIAQPNAAQHLKWQPDKAQEFYARLIAQTEAPAFRPLSMVIWPETAVPFLLNERADLQAEVSAAAGGVPVVLGIRRYEDGWYNSLAVLGAGGNVLGRYDKSHLVPFGEYVPLRGTLGQSGLGAFVDGLAGSFRAGEGPGLITIDGLPRFQPLICYEAIFPHKVGGPDRPDVLLQITNDAWFGQFSGPYQHLAQARMRAIEQGLPLVRSANTGISAMIDGRGRITASLPLGEAGYVDAALPNPLGTTAYALWGDRIFLGLLAIATLALAALGLIARRQRS